MHCWIAFLAIGWFSSPESHEVSGSSCRPSNRTTSGFGGTSSFSLSKNSSGVSGTLTKQHQAQTEKSNTDLAPGFWCLFRLVRVSKRGCFACSAGLPKAQLEYNTYFCSWSSLGSKVFLVSLGCRVVLVDHLRCWNSFGNIWDLRKLIPQAFISQRMYMEWRSLQVEPKTLK